MIEAAQLKNLRLGEVSLTVAVETWLEANHDVD